MARTVTMPDRLGGLLPRNTPVAHKTGTVGGVANDAGYITLPDGRRFAIVVFTRGSNTPPTDRERAVAEVARTLYDYFLIHPPTPRSPGLITWKNDGKLPRYWQRLFYWGIVLAMPSTARM